MAAEKKAAEIRSLDDILEKRLYKDELKEVNRILYGNPTRLGI